MLDGSLFALKYLPPNEESRSSGFSPHLLRSDPDTCAVLPCPLPAAADEFDKIVARLLVARCYMLL